MHSPALESFSFLGNHQPKIHSINNNIEAKPETKDSSHKLGNTNILIYGILSAKNRERMIFCSLIWLIAFKLKMWTIVWCTLFFLLAGSFGPFVFLSRQSSNPNRIVTRRNDTLYSKDVFSKMILLNFARFLPFLAIAQIFAVPCFCFGFYFCCRDYHI